MICAATEVYMTLWNGRPEKVIVLAELKDEIRLSTCKRIEIVSDGHAKSKKIVPGENKAIIGM